eukprot:TRINITY_DN1295_c0_g1_i3.p1 TRINITY_DN1295_c0_g1~~TRINITY_DN1295_c0_g1_i3.p1  ORF type:complete len:542 (-),score=102.07 TRINITY_DN1295_c0_g1_i3:207-1832(-)
MEEKGADEVLGRIGNFGKYQLRVIGFVQFVGVFAAWQLLSSSFMLPEVDFWCSPPELNLPRGIPINWTSPIRPGEDKPDSCLMYDIDYENVTEQTIETEGVVNTTCSRWDYSRSKSPESVASQFNLVCGNDYLRSLSQSLYMAGKMVGALGSGMLSDKFGRKRMILIASISVLFFGVVIAFSPSMIVFTILRSCVAASTTALFTCGFVYCMELVGGKWSTLVSFGLEYSWALGYITIPLIAWAVPRWDHLQLAASIPTAIFVAVMAFPSLVPESPKWLLVNGKLKEAEEILIKAEHENGRKSTQIKQVHNSTYTDQEANGEKKSQNVTVLNLFKTPSLRRCTLIMYYLWFTNNLVYYGLTFNAGKLIPGDIHTNMVISAALEFLAYSVAIVCFLYLGRRWSTSSFMICGGVFLLLTTVVSSTTGKIVLAQLGKFAITASFAMVYQYAAEMFPTVVRNVGVGSCSFFSRFGSILAPFVGRELGSASPVAPIFIFGFTSILGGVLALILPETNNKTLPNTIQEGEEFCNQTQFCCIKKTEKAK